MKNFSFYNPVKIHFGKNQISKISRELKNYQRILLTYGGGSIKKNGVYEQVMEALDDKYVIEFSGIQPNPRYENLMKAVELAREEKIDFILAVGGGSVIDGSKFIAAAINFEGDEPWEIISKHAKIEHAIPLGTVLTLPATGSEMNGNTVINRDSSKEKLSTKNEKLMPRFSILDPETAYSLPDRQISNGIADAFVHVMEQFCTTSLNTPIQDQFAIAVLATLVEEGPKLLQNRKDYDANANFMWAATNALNGVLSTGVDGDWTTHMIGHELTAFHNLDHARALTIVLPAVLDMMRKEKEGKLCYFAKNLWGIQEENSNKAIDLAIKKMEEFFKSLGMPLRLSEYEIKEDTIERIVERFEQRGTLLGEHQNINAQTVKEILMKRL